MAKYSFELKMKVVNDYLSGKGGYIFLGRKYGIDDCMVEKFVKTYKAFGSDGLKRSRKRKEYSFEFKLNAVELYLSNEVSYLEASIKLGLANSSLLARWVSAYRVAGPEGLRPRMKGRKNTLKENDIKHTMSVEPADTSEKHVRELEDELLRLRIENAYLKELRRLRLEEEELLRKRRELSTASEENSD